MSAVVPYLQVREKQAENDKNSFLRQSHTDTEQCVALGLPSPLVRQEGLCTTGSRNTDVYGLAPSRSHSQPEANREVAPSLLCHNHRCRLSQSGCLEQYFLGGKLFLPPGFHFLLVINS